ncbi:MAG: glycosyltransferase [Acidimicrobiales bacterium]
MDVTVVVPAHNEERLIGAGLDAIALSAQRGGLEHEVVVVANRCTDDTESIASERSARVVLSEARNLSAVRNAGFAAANGPVVVTIDADTRLHPDGLGRIADLLADPTVVGGGCRFVPERTSPGINATVATVRALTRVARVSGVVFWSRLVDVAAIGGFDEDLLVGEDVDFARRLRRHGRRTGRRRFVTLDTPATISTRKFDRYGDWHMFAMAKDLPAIWASMTGRDTRWVDRYFHDYADRD